MLGNAQLPVPRWLFSVRASKGFAAGSPTCCCLWALSAVRDRLLSRHLPLASPWHIRLNLINVWLGWRQPWPSRPLLSDCLPARRHLICVQTRQRRELHGESEHVCRTEINWIWGTWTVSKFESRPTPDLRCCPAQPRGLPGALGLGDETTCHLIPRFSEAS